MPSVWMPSDAATRTDADEDADLQCLEGACGYYWVYLFTGRPEDETNGSISTPIRNAWAYLCANSHRGEYSNLGQVCVSSNFLHTVARYSGLLQLQPLVEDVPLTPLATRGRILRAIRQVRFRDIGALTEWGRRRYHSGFRIFSSVDQAFDSGADVQDYDDISRTVTTNPTLTAVQFGVQLDRNSSSLPLLVE
ncbi:hypothetical protein BDN72DRAFT_858913 [Pluteus cervinus]|uniref:Uncharacterized protein n=1 Tax=Pluteus cervinus TaxID=181527 RepID=A0ACD3APT0_9AGAR|nr:hypothetical protein BDN72DRAFT_858913 [Pluteus cervinus]